MISAEIRGKTILAVDDSLINLKLLNVILGHEGFSLLTTSNSLEATSLAFQHTPDLILLDVMMPGLSGIEILKQLKQNSQTQNIPILMVTARTKGEDVREALESGAFDYIKKPLDEIEIVARVRSALRYKANQDKLLEMAMKDSLTGLYNHALLLDLLDKEIYNANRKKLGICFAMMDIDHFKSVNDQYGHQAGDFVLQEVSRILTGCLRKGDPIGRYGGEEFGVILLGVELSQAKILCERIRLTIEKTDFRINGATISVTISIGLVFSKFSESENYKAEKVISDADKALYTAKETGRNKLIIAS